jgi:hypothetical protein
MVVWGAKSKKTILLGGVLAPVLIYLLLGVALHVRFPMLLSW